MRAMILAAGRGERMRPLTDHTPKPLLPVGGKPLIVWHLEKLAAAGFQDVVINLGHLGEQIPVALGEGTQWGLRLHYSQEPPGALETAGGIRHALPLLGDGPFLVLNGDIFCDWPVAQVYTLAREMAPHTLAHLVLIDNPPHHPNGDFVLSPGRLKNPVRPELVEGQGPLYLGLRQAQPERFKNDQYQVHAEGEYMLTFSGIGLYRPELFAHLPDPEPTKLAPLLRTAMAENRITGEHFFGRWVDVGTPERLAELDKTVRLHSPGFYARLEAALRTPEPASKCAQVRALWADWQAGNLLWPDRPAAQIAPAEVFPAASLTFPECPELLPPQQVRSRNMGSALGRVTMLHAVAHIEYNAVNLALDAACRFRQLPREFTEGWLRVAHEEVEHFTLVTQHMAELGYAYGDLPAHRGLWDMACKTAHDPLVRMALIPRLFEARGLDVTPGMAEKFRQVGDHVAVAILEIILREEIGHVALGDVWFRQLCAERGLNPEATYLELLQQYDAPRLKPPFNTKARLAAGFTAEELAVLEKFSKYE